MRYETFDEIFTYIGEAPEHTPEEKEQIKKSVEAARLNLLKNDERIRRGIRFDGSKM